MKKGKYANLSQEKPELSMMPAYRRRPAYRNSIAYSRLPERTCSAPQAIRATAVNGNQIRGWWTGELRSRPAQAATSRETAAALSQ